MRVCTYSTDRCARYIRVDYQQVGYVCWWYRSGGRITCEKLQCELRIFNTSSTSNMIHRRHAPKSWPTHKKYWSHFLETKLISRLVSCGSSMGRVSLPPFSVPHNCVVICCHQLLLLHTILLSASPLLEKMRLSYTNLFFLGATMSTWHAAAASNVLEHSFSKGSNHQI